MDIAAKNNSCSVYIENSQAHIATRLSNDSEQPYKESGNYVQLLVTNHSESFLKKIQMTIFCIKNALILMSLLLMNVVKYGIALHIVKKAV